jgi:hypothetical protein
MEYVSYLIITHTYRNLCRIMYNMSTFSIRVSKRKTIIKNSFSGRPETAGEGGGRWLKLCHIPYIFPRFKKAFSPKECSCLILM